MLAGEQARGAAGTVGFQLSGNGAETMLTIYSADTHTLYVYPGVTAGGSTVPCSFMLHLSRAGGPVQRENCQPGDLLPGH